jgi:calpain-15
MKLIENLFITKEVNDEGIYWLRFFKNGEWEEIVVDDYFPCYPKGGPIFSYNTNNELWLLLLEKAYAKLHGSYGNLLEGTPIEAFYDLTGLPCTSLTLRDESVYNMMQTG